MGGSVTFSVLRGIPQEAIPDQAIRAADEWMASPPKCSRWSDYQYEPALARVVAAWSEDVLVMMDLSTLMQPVSWRIAQAISRIYSCPWMELRQQEGDHWDFTLWRRSGDLVADFSTRVAAFDYENARPRPWKAGGPRAVAEIWGVPLAHIKRYLVDWDALPTAAIGTEKAYESDSHCYGDCDQLHDFMRAIGAIYPYGKPDQIEFEAPSWQACYRRQPWIRRVIRSVSVKIKGRYPDMPRPSTEDRRLW